MSGLRFFVIRCLRGGSLGCELIAIVWIVRLCVAHCVVEMIMMCLIVIRANPSPFMLLRCIMRVSAVI